MKYTRNFLWDLPVKYTSNFSSSSSCEKPIEESLCRKLGGYRYWQMSCLRNIWKFLWLMRDRLSLPILDVIKIQNVLISFQLFIYRFFANANLKMNICKYLFVFVALLPFLIFFCLIHIVYTNWFSVFTSSYLRYISGQLLMEAVLKMFVKSCS